MEPTAIVRDLLRIAKIAMPGKLYAEDPRVIRAQAWLDDQAKQEAIIAELDRATAGTPPSSAPGRVPSVGRR